MNLKAILAVTVIGVVTFGIASADVIVQKKTTMDNLLGMGSSSTTETEYFRADRYYSESLTSFDNKMMQMAMGGKDAKDGSIIRLDKGIIQNLNFKNKTYTEADLNQWKKVMDNSSDDMSGMMNPEADGMPDESAPDEDEYTWTYDVKTDDKPVEVNGFKCTHITGTATGVNKTDSSKKIIMTTEEWRSEDVPGVDQIEAYQQNYAKQLGIDEAQAQELGQALQGFSSPLAGMSEELKDIKGLPVKTVITMEVSPSAMDQGDEDSESADEMSEQNEAASKAMEKLGGMFGKKDKKKDKEAEKPLHEGFKKMMTTTSEILSVKATDVPDSQYDVPTGFTKEGQ